ncbi:FAD-binding oxidoreductase [Nitrosococcus wardiae]|uniref:Delta(24)-sterol reductase n=1 Tax=Nitrosococcus wardiae TaxID=1814290 RepID=A0A4P7BZD0_9GAMM|nr:FAD-binding oxidoreductase [Nitrosococcus wardiae]QBQ55451.1 FAD-binding oxidoreductase [Nitrosococcus wardiae]
MTQPAYQQRLQQLKYAIGPPSHQKIRIKKRTTSNLFRYQGRQPEATKVVSLQDFNHILHLDRHAQTLEVEGLTTYEQIVDETLAHGFLPTIAPELKHITIGGATVGIGIESAGYRYGFVHDGLMEADVLLPEGRIITCTADNAYSDLFHALPNSYGTLGYILRAKIKLIPAKPYVQIRHTQFNQVHDYLEAMKKAVELAQANFIEGLFYNPHELYLTEANFTKSAPQLDDIYQNIYYKTARQKAEMFLPTKQYIFRYDPDWFWNVPETGFYWLFRKLAPLKMRSSGFYNRYTTWKNKLYKILHIDADEGTEQLIQDWEVPWEQAENLVHFALENVDLQDQPWVALPIIPSQSPTLYPLQAHTLYFNLGCYCLTPKPREDEDFYYTKRLDQECFRLGGLKMLYSSTFIDKKTFDCLYNGAAYDRLKQKYDPHHCAPTLFDKAVENQ